MQRISFGVVLATVLVVGCENDPVVPVAADPPAAISAADSGTTQSPAAPEMTFKPAEAGVTGKGTGYDKDNPAAIVTTPIGIYFGATEQLLFDLIKKDLTEYEIVNNRYPSSHEEFMEQIIRASARKLPTLPAGHEYWYDAESHTLMVKYPKP